MPIYGYRCGQCGHELEVLQSMSDAPLKVCPNCMGPLRKLIYPAGIIYKGTGYYTTDYKSSTGGSQTAAKGEGGADSGGGSDAGSGGESKGDSKGDSKSDGKADSKPAAKEAAKPSPAGKKSAD